ncbi:DUF3516 domain-containing protein, partial [Bdellovibrionota bacterium FG-2]
GVAWQIPLLTLPQVRFLLMSATLGDVTFFEKALTKLNHCETVTVSSAERPVPLDFEYSEIPVHEAVAKLISRGRAPIYLVSFTQKGCADEAQNFMSVDICTKEEKRAIAQELEGFKFSSPYGKEIHKFIRHGLGVHHAGLLPKYRVLVERLAQKGLLKIIFGTDTLGVGVNVPIRTVLFTKLCKFDGQKTTILSVRDFKQISGRAGRKGFDDRGTVVVQAPEHVIENLRQEEKAVGDAKKLKKLVKRKPPEKGFLPWNKETFERLVQGQPEALVSQFRVTHAMLLQVLGRTKSIEYGGLGLAGKEAGRAMRKLISDSHESDHAKRQHRRKAFELFRSLVDRKIIELNPLRVNVDLQEDFSLNQTLSLYLIDTVATLDPQSENYALDVLTLVESILENPEMILRKQLDLVKTEKMQELKAQGMEFDERIAELEKLEYPKPNRDFIYDTFNVFSAKHPWVGQENIRPKSIAREMVEFYASFADYIQEYDLHRGEGLLLRYLFDTYKTLVQTVPSLAKNEEIELIEVYLGTLVRAVDSSLLEEWERMRNPDKPRLQGAVSNAQELELQKAGRKKFQIQLRNEVFRVVRALSQRDYETVLMLVQSDIDSSTQGAPCTWTTERLEKLMEEYLSSGHSRIKTDTQARAPKHQTLTEPTPGSLHIEQVLVDPEELNDWVLSFDVDLALSELQGKPELRLIGFGPIL